MKKIYLLILLIGFCCNWQIFAQVTNLDVNFDNGQPAFVVINSDAAQPSFSLSVVSGVLNIAATKRATDWSFMGLFSQNLNISALPTVQFSVKSSTDVTFLVRLKSPKISDPLTQTQIEKTVTLTGGEDFKSFFFDLTADIAATPDFNPLNIAEIHIDCSNGWLNTYSGTVELDYLQIGFPKQIPSKGTGFTETFDAAGVPAGVILNTKYTFSQNDGALEVNANRDGRWFGFNYELDGSYDISANPFINVRVKTDNDMVMQVFLIDADGNGYQTALVGSQYKYDELVSNKYVFRSARIYKGNSFNTVTFDFSAAATTILNLKKIAKIKFVSNGTAMTFGGKYFIDEIRVGDQATKMAYIGQISEQNYLKNSTGTKEVLIPEIKNAASLNVSGGTSLVSNTALTSITYTSSTEDGISIQYGFAKLTYELVADAEGSDTITLTAAGNSGFANNTMKFPVNVKANNPPTINPVTDVIVQNNILNEIKLSGITSGDTEASQALTLTAVSNNSSVVDVVSVDYSSPDHYGKISFTSKSPGTAEITLTVTDDQAADTVTSFTVTSYASLNQPPVIDQVTGITVTNTSGEQSITLTGIGDGDNSNQNLTIEAVSSAPGIIPNPSIVYVQGSNTATMTFNPSGTTGLANISVSITDDGGNANNDGNKTAILQIPIQVIVFNPTGWEFDLSAPDVLSRFAPENPGVVFLLAIVDTLGGKAMRVTMRDKWTYGGIWMDIPSELNLSAVPVVSYEIFSKSKATWHWNYFYDASGDRNTQNSADHQFQAAADTWTTLSFDYRQPGDLNNDGGNPINASRITDLLINVHDIKPSWPFTNASGVFYIRNIKFGDKAVYTAEQVYASINPIGNQSAYENGGNQTINLSGISNGNKGTDNITITATSSSKTVGEVISVSAINADGTATLTYNPLTSGSTVINIKIEAPGAVVATVSGILTVLKNNPADYAKLIIDKTIKYQTMRGFGTFQPDPRFGDIYAKDLGASVVRLGIIGNQWEPENDNTDPNVINMEGFNYDAFDWDYLRTLKANGVETFIITSWSPPAWMKRNLSLDHKEQAIEWEKTDNILEPYYYEEFAESMVALVKAMKQEAGIDILAIGLQNEPYFNEPYSSAILGGPQFVQLIKIVGDRFKKEGLSSIGFYMPEQVFGIGSGYYSCEGYLATLKSDALADEYCQYFAVHGYDATGITPGFPTYSGWARLRELAQQGNHPKETWMTETFIGYSDWTSALNLAGAIHGSLWAGKISLWSNWSFDGVQVTKNLPNSSFYTSKNYYKYIRPGAVQVDAKSDNSNLLVTAFENTDGKFAMVIINKGTRAVSARIYGSNLPEAYHIYRSTMSENCVDAGILNTIETTMIFPASSVITLVADGNVTLTMSQVADTTIKMNSAETSFQVDGISDGAGSVNDLTLAFENSNPGLFSNFSVSAIGSDGKATISFTPAIDQVGVAQIRLSLSNTGGTKRQVIFYVFVIDATGVKEINNGFYRIYPNPTSGVLNIEFSPNQFREFAVTDITGRLILRHQITSDHFSMNVNNWNKGVYLIKMTGDTNTKLARFVVE
jgi:glucuronoarabinoxylan endo-1,4-beta-xylanase